MIVERPPSGGSDFACVDWTAWTARTILRPSSPTGLAALAFARSRNLSVFGA